MYVIHENDLGCGVKQVFWDHVHTCIYSIDNTIITVMCIIMMNSDECRKALDILLSVFHRLGLPVAENKLEGPCVCLKFLVFELDSRKMEIRLPEGKLRELQHLISDWQDRKSSTKKELESLVGKLVFAMRVVKPGKIFLRHMFELLSGIRQPHHHV